MPSSWEMPCWQTPCCNGANNCRMASGKLEISTFSSALEDCALQCSKGHNLARLPCTGSHQPRLCRLCAAEDHRTTRSQSTADVTVMPLSAGHELMLLQLIPVTRSRRRLCCIEVCALMCSGSSIETGGK